MSMTAELFFVLDVLHAGQTGYGVLHRRLDRGMVAGAVRLGSRDSRRRGSRPSLWRRSRPREPGSSGASIATALGVALAGFALGGIAHGVKNVAIRTLIHQRVPEALRGRAFAGYNAARNAAELGALGLGGVLVDVAGARSHAGALGRGPPPAGAAALLITTAAAPTRPTPRRPGGRSMHTSKADLTAHTLGDYEGRMADSGDWRIAFESMPASFPPDDSPFSGLPDDRCQCRHLAT